MTDPHTIKTSEFGAVRVFTTELAPEGDAAITAANVHLLLGKDIKLNPKKVEVFPARALAGMGLSAYLSEGYGIREADLAGKAAALDALTGLVVLIPTSAFGGIEQTIDPNPALRFIGTFREPHPEPPVDMASFEAAEGQMTPPATGPDLTSLRRRKGSWIVALGALVIAATLVLFAVF